LVQQFRSLLGHHWLYTLPTAVDLEDAVARLPADR
jgi:hypothetical protein